MDFVNLYIYGVLALWPSVTSEDINSEETYIALLSRNLWCQSQF